MRCTLTWSTCGRGTLGCGLLCSKAATSDTSLPTESSVKPTDDDVNESSNCSLSMWYNVTRCVIVCHYVTRYVIMYGNMSYIQYITQHGCIQQCVLVTWTNIKAVVCRGCIMTELCRIDVTDIVCLCHNCSSGVVLVCICYPRGVVMCCYHFRIVILLCHCYPRG